MTIRECLLSLVRGSQTRCIHASRLSQLVINQPWWLAVWQHSATCLQISTSTVNSFKEYWRMNARSSVGSDLWRICWVTNQGSRPNYLAWVGKIISILLCNQTAAVFSFHRPNTWRAGIEVWPKPVLITEPLSDNRWRKVTWAWAEPSPSCTDRSDKRSHVKDEWQNFRKITTPGI